MIPPGKTDEMPYNSEGDRRRWSLTRLLAFRFLFVYLLLYLPPAVSWLIPGLGWVEASYNAVAYPSVAWVVRHLFYWQPPITVFNHGGDRTYNYFEVLVIGIIAALACGLWSIVASTRRSQPMLHGWLRVIVRYSLAINMLNYGFGKVFKVQFPFPLLDRLLEPYGQSSPMGLLWTFMGYSPTYNIFAGAVEVIGAMLLFWRRTTLLGALLLIASLTNVVVLNFTYDVPVKLYSTHLLALAVYLLLPDFERLWSVLLLDRYVPRAEFVERVSGAWMPRAAAGIKGAFICAMLFAIIHQYLQIARNYHRPISPRYGIYEVESFVEDGESRAAHFGDSARWRRVVINENGTLSVQTMDDAIVQWRTTERLPERTFELSGTIYPRDPRRRAVLRYSEPGSDQMVLEGTYDGRAIHARLSRTQQPSFVLLDRGFHWINEYHYNR